MEIGKVIPSLDAPALLLPSSLVRAPTVNMEMGGTFDCRVVETSFFFCQDMRIQRGMGDLRYHCVAHYQLPSPSHDHDSITPWQYESPITRSVLRSTRHLSEKEEDHQVECDTAGEGGDPHTGKRVNLFPHTTHTRTRLSLLIM